MLKTPLDHALELALKGFAVFPVSTDKTPRCPHGHKAASTDPARIRAMHAQFGFVLIGVATGEASNLAVVDIDRQHNGEELWQAICPHPPATFRYQTRAGGQHVWFRHKIGLRCSASRIAPGIDVRAEGGYIIYWPCTGLPVLCDAPLAEWPDWLVPPPRPLPAPPTLPAFTGNAAAQRYAEAAMANAIKEVVSAPVGTRNTTLNRVCYSLARLAHAGVVTFEEIAWAMAHAGHAAGLETREVERTITSALAARGGRA